jgi:hypothetical protein
VAGMVIQKKCTHAAVGGDGVRKSPKHAVQLARVVCGVKFCHSAELAARGYLNERGVPFSAASMLTR